MKPSEIIVGKRYTDGKTVREVVGLKPTPNMVSQTRVEYKTISGRKAQGEKSREWWEGYPYCTIEAFCRWAKRNTKERL